METTVNSQLAETPLHDWHASHGGRMVDFAGWSMPVQYSSIVEEHLATRNAATLFDVSHMGRLGFSGPGVAEFLDSLVTRRVANMAAGRIRYALVTNEAGGILDDVLVYRLEDASGGAAQFQMVVNASNREKIVAWIKSLLPEGITFEDQTTQTCMIAVQGPQAVGLMGPLLDVDLAAMKYYTGQSATIVGHPGFVSRTGYTGEDGCEVIADAGDALYLWETILEAGQSIPAVAAGLACRDTLRLEAAMPLYGHELSESINPVQAGLGFAINLKDRKFIGHDAIAGFKEDPTQSQRVGLLLASRRIPREGYAILRGEETVGEVTSGTFSPTLQKPIAMGYVKPEFAEIGTELSVEVRSHRERAQVVPLPFYQRES